MAIIKYKKTENKEIKIHNCFCGHEPELIEEFSEVGNYRRYFVSIQCPYCSATPKRRHSYDTFNPYAKAVEMAIEDWEELTTGEREF